MDINASRQPHTCLAWLAWLALPWLGLACLSAWLVLANSNNNGGAKRRPPAEGGRVVVFAVDNDDNDKPS